MNNPNIEAREGDIPWSDNNFNKSGRSAHYMVFIKPHYNHSFIGAMITHSKRFNNIHLVESHFKKTDDRGKNYKVLYDNSLIVSQPLFKNLDWSPFIKVGELTKEGITYIKEHILSSEPGIYFDNAQSIY